MTMLKMKEYILTGHDEIYRYFIFAVGGIYVFQVLQLVD